MRRPSFNVDWTVWNQEAGMTEFESRIKNYPSIWASYESAVESSLEAGHSEEEMEYFISENCRAYFFENHLKVEREASDQEIRDVNKSPIVPFQMSEVQLKLLDLFESRMRVGKKFRQRVMKCRRARVSTLYLAIGYHIVRFGKNKKGLCFCDRLETSRKLRRIIDIFYQTDDLIRKPEIGKRTLAEGLYLNHSGDKNVTEKDSFILLGSGEQKNSGVGGSLDFFHWSEASLTMDQEKHWTTISPSLQGALFDIAESTPSMTGQDSIIFPEFESPSPNCDAVFISWLDIKEYRFDDKSQIELFDPYVDHNLYGKEAEVMGDNKASVPQMLWRRYKLDEIKNLNSFRQVFPISIHEAFYSSAGLFFHKEIIDMTRPKVPVKAASYIFSDQGHDVSAMPDSTGMWNIYHRRDMDSNYLISVDVSEGKCADKEMRDPDYSVAMIFRITNVVEEVAFFRDRIPPEILAEQVAVAARYYNNAMVIPERNGPGLAFLVRLTQIYGNIYRQQKYQSGSFVLTQDYGFQTTSTTKVHALSCLLSQIREKEKGLTIHTDVVRLEMSKFVSQGVKLSAMAGFHDDTISTLWLMAVCLYHTPSLVKNRNLIGHSEQDVRYSAPTISRENSWQYQHKYGY
jgi:hypothetical protein